MSRIYTVVTGDTLTKISAKFGQASWRVIYDAPENAAFRKQRPNPDRIYPGDRLVIPGVQDDPKPPALDGFIPVVGTEEVKGVVRGSDPAGVWEHLLVNLSEVRMEVHKRSPGTVEWGLRELAHGIKGQPGFHATLMAIRGGRRCIITQGGFQNLPLLPKPFDRGYFMGGLTIGGMATSVTSSDPPRPERAALSFFDNPSLALRFKVTSAPGGSPAAGCLHGIGSLIPLIVGGKRSAKDKLWDVASSRGQVGWTVVGIHRAANLLSIFCQRDPRQGGEGRRLTADQLQDRYLREGWEDAVMLDGSDSILLDYAGTLIIEPRLMKQRINQTFLCFIVPGSATA